MSDIILKTEKLNTRIFCRGYVVNPVCDLDLELAQGEILGIIGESGCGKTMSMLSLTNLLPQNAKIVSGKIYFNNNSIENNSQSQLRLIRGSEISYIFQDATSSLNPLFSIGEQIKEVFLAHKIVPREKAKQAVWKVLDLVNLKPAANYYSYFPHQLSGGMNQRAMIAMAIASKPKLIIADEPTSNLDRITEIKILNLLKNLNKELRVSIILITHNISIIQGFADNVAIMYAGRIVEQGKREEVLHSPKHPYTKALLDCQPKKEQTQEYLNTIEGRVANLSALPTGCKFHPRCPRVMQKCKDAEPEFKKFSETQFSKCYL